MDIRKTKVKCNMTPDLVFRAYQCKLYLRKYGLRLTGNKGVLVERVKMHLEVINGGGEKKYPPSSFVLNCKGDACTGDVVMFEQKVYEMFNIASRSATGPPCGTRMVAGRIVKESYGAAKQQHTFTIEVLWSTGEKPLPPLHPLLIKGRNLYRLGTMRQRWDDEEKRRQVIQEKHSRGNEARSTREIRIKEKESRKLGYAKRTVSKTNQLKPETSKPKTMPEFNSNNTVLQQNSARQDQNCTPVNQTQTTFTHQYSNHQPRAVNPIRHSQNCNYVQNENHRPMHYNQTPRGHDYWGQLMDRYRQNPNCPIRSPTSQQGQPRKWCRYYLQGTCHFGNRCKFLHE